ncbi:restriction endonuclease [Bacillus gobiensis]|uniref:restriction endonuclease n=1 Tax=Bacillus gobiensis TaxID=1441095 RepID=UPI003D1EFB9E
MKKYKKRSQHKDPLSFLSVLIALLVFFYSSSIPLAIFVFFGIVGMTLAFHFFRRKQKEDRLKRSDIKEIDHMDGVQFEYYLAALFKHIGYKVKTTKASFDYGADLVMDKDGERIVVQAKRHLKKVGISAVQEISAAKTHYKANDAWVVTNSFFTNPAIELAKSNGVKMIDRKELIDLILRMSPGAIPNAAAVKMQVTPKTIHCPLCDAKMIEREGKNGKFYGCSRYPACRGTKNI